MRFESFEGKRRSGFIEKFVKAQGDCLKPIRKLKDLFETVEGEPTRKIIPGSKSPAWNLFPEARASNRERLVADMPT